MAKKPETETMAAPVNNTAPTEAEAPATVQLGVQDLQNAAQIIDIAMSRGAFRANEAAQVGAVYNKIEAFIKSVAESQNQNAEAPASQ
tara:strand:+ start:452 stop:715 length:264 start_codon:yes stop_codon:yes gene_type:complete